MNARVRALGVRVRMCVIMSVESARRMTQKGVLQKSGCITKFLVLSRWRR